MTTEPIRSDDPPASRPVCQPKCRLLLLEDSPADARLIRRFLSELEKPRFVVQHEIRLEDALQYLIERSVDVVLLDLSLPDSQGLETFRTFSVSHPALPIVVLTGTDDDDMAQQAVAAGAQDYIGKAHLDVYLLSRAIRYAIQRKQNELERERLIDELQQALDQVRTLEALLPICSYCHKIRDDQGYWNHLEVYIHERTGTQFSHGLCPDCARKYYAEWLDNDSE